MRSTLDELLTELAELKALVASIDPVNDALMGQKNTLVQQYVSIRRRFDYAAFAVALYASFEKFLENLITAYMRLEARRLDYAALPKKLTHKHLAGTAEVLWRGRLGDGRFDGLSELGAIKNLFECLSGTKPYELNEAVVIAHDANLRAGEVDRLFAAIGIEHICEHACRTDMVLAWHCAAHGLEAPPQDGVSRTVIEERLRDIVERRNQVAHRGGKPDNLLGSVGMSDAIGFIESFSKSVFAIAVGRYLHNHRAGSGQGILLQQRQHEGPYQNGTVVVVEKPAQRLFVGQPIFVIVETNGARWGRIQSMQIDNADVRTVELDVAAGNGIGIALDFKCPKRASLVALPFEDDVVWSPPTESDAATA